MDREPIYFSVLAWPRGRAGPRAPRRARSRRIPTARASWTPRSQAGPLSAAGAVAARSSSSLSFFLFSPSSSSLSLSRTLRAAADLERRYSPLGEKTGPTGRGDEAAGPSERSAAGVPM